MSNKFVKISIVLIFMLFVMGLFNFCFAYEFNEDNYDVKYSFNVGSYTYRIGLYDIEFDRLTKDNSIGHNTSSSNFEVSNIDSYSKIYGTHFSLDTLYCIVLPADNSGNNFTSLHNINGVLSCGSNGSSYYIYEYDFDTEMWTYKTYTSSLFIQVGSVSYPLRNFISFDNEVKIYNDNTIDNLLFSSDDFVDSIPTDEELITGCDFNVRLEFGNGDNLLDTYPTNNHIGMQQVTIIHSLTNWNNYNVKLSITLEEYGWLISQRFHYSMYSMNMTSSEIKDVNTICIEEPVLLDIVLNDYLAIYSAQEDKYVRLVYKVYSKFTEELLLTRTIRFRFDGDGFILQDSSDINGSILEDTLQDSDGNIVENNDNNVISNGTDLSDINTDFDFSSGFDLDVDTLKGTLENSIDSSKSFFDLFSTFLGLLPIWISTLLYFFLFGIIIITLYRFLRGA